MLYRSVRSIANPWHPLFKQERVLKLLEFVVCSLNFVPVAELAGFLGVLTGTNGHRYCKKSCNRYVALPMSCCHCCATAPGLQTSTFALCLRSANKFVQYNPQYHVVLREVCVFVIHACSERCF